MTRTELENILHNNGWDTEVHSCYFLKFLNNDTFYEVETLEDGVSITHRNTKNDTMLQFLPCVPYDNFIVSIEGDLLIYLGENHKGMRIPIIGRE